MPAALATTARASWLSEPAPEIDPLREVLRQRHIVMPREAEQRDAIRGGSG